MKLKYFKLLNGDDIIGLVEKDNGRSVRIHNPIQVTTFRIDGTGEMIFDLNPWTFSANTDIVEIKNTMYMGPFDCKPYLREQYAMFVNAEKKKNGFLDQNSADRKAALDAYTSVLLGRQRSTRMDG